MLALLPLLLIAEQTSSDISVQAPHGREQTFIAPSGEPFHSYGDQPYPVAKWFADADANHDGKIDPAEFDADFLRFFDELDTNHDGAIDGLERTHYENDIAPETLGGAFDLIESAEDDPDMPRLDSDVHTSDERPKPAYGTHPVGAARFDLLALPEPVASMDVQIRGRISRKDALEASHTRFNKLDAQHRGYLTLDTLPYTFAQNHGHWRKRR